MNKEQKDRYRVDGKKFELLSEARKYRKKLAESSDSPVTIFRAEKGYFPDPRKLEWIPFE